MSATKFYDFCDPKKREEWLDIVVALIEYLRSGESRVGFMNKNVEENLLHKHVEIEVERIESENVQSEALEVSGTVQDDGDSTMT